MRLFLSDVELGNEVKTPSRFKLAWEAFLMPDGFRQAVEAYMDGVRSDAKLKEMNKKYILSLRQNRAT